MRDATGKRLVGASVVERRLGVHRVTVGRWFIDGRIPGTRIGSRYYMTADALDALIRAAETVPAAEGNDAQ